MWLAGISRSDVLSEYRSGLDAPLAWSVCHPHRKTKIRDLWISTWERLIPVGISIKKANSYVWQGMQTSTARYWV